MKLYRLFFSLFCLLLLSALTVNAEVEFRNNRLILQSTASVSLSENIDAGQAQSLAVMKAEHQALQQAANFLTSRSLLEPSPKTQDVLVYTGNLINSKILSKESTDTAVQVNLLVNIDIRDLRKRLNRAASDFYARNQLQHFYQQKTKQIADIETGNNKKQLAALTVLKSVQRLEKGFYTNAYYLKVDHYTAAIQINPEYARAYALRGHAYDNLGESENALSDLNQAMAIDSADALTLCFRGLYFYKAGDLIKAMTDFNRSIHIAPDNESARFHRAILLRAKGQYQQAIDDLNQAIVLDSTESAAWHNRGLCYADLNQFRKALEDYNRSIQLDSDDDNSWNSMGLAWYHLEKNQEAIEAFSRAIQLNAESIQALYNRGTVYFETDAYQQAIDDFSAILKIDSGHVEALQARSAAYEQLGRQGESSQDIKTAYQQDSGNTDILLEMGNLAFNKEEFGKAIDFYTRVLNQNPKHLIARYYRGLSFKNTEQYHKAHEDLLQAIQLDSTDAEKYLNIGIVCSNINDRAAALQFYTKSIQKTSELPESFYNRGLIYQNKGMYSEAVQDFDRYIQLRPDDPDGYIQRAGILTDFGKYAQAVSDYKRVIPMTADKKEVFINLGHCFFEQEVWDSSAVYYGKAITLDQQDEMTLLNRAAACINGYNEKENYTLLELAKKDCEQVLTLNANNARGHYLMGHIEDKMGFYESAKNHFNKAHALNPDQY